MTTDPKASLNTISSHLRALHKLLLEYEKRIYETTFGRVENPYQLLHLAMEDAQFAWLRAMSAEMVHLDERRLNRDGVTETDLRLMGTRLRALMVTDRVETSFQQHLAMAREADPTVILAYRQLMTALPQAPAVDLFLSAGGEQDSKDPLPGAIRPGALVPGFGDKGYYALGAIEERGLLSEVPLKSMRYANETVLGVASVPMKWTVNEEAIAVDAWTPVVVQAGTGATVSRIPAADGVLVGLFVRQKSVGGEAEMLVQDHTDDDDWLQLANAEMLGNEIAAYARIAPPDTVISVPGAPDHDVLLYVLAGEIEVDGVQIEDSRLALVRHPQDLVVKSNSDTMFLAILVDPNAVVTRAGSVAR